VVAGLEIDARARFITSRTTTIHHQLVIRHERQCHPDQVMRVYRARVNRHTIIHYINLRRITLGFSLVLPLVLGLDA